MLEAVNKENFNELLGRFSTGELETLVEKFPYFQHAHLLLAKKYQQQNNPRFDQQLQLAALYTQDRELLYAIFNEKAVAVALPQLPRTEVVEPQAEDVQQHLDSELSPPVTDPIVDLSPETKPSLELVDTNTETEAIFTAVAPDEDLTEPDKLKAQAVIVEDYQQKEHTEPLIEAEIGSNTLLTTIDAQENQQVVQQFGGPEPEVKEEVTDAATGHVEQFSAAEPHTFDEWLKAYTGGETPKIAPLEREIVPVEPEQQDEELEKLYLTNIPVNLQELVEEETNYSKGLDKFIEQQIQRHKGVTVKATANENELDPELVTETMAKVYEMQKKYQKAIKCYQTLGLKYPEKFDFFAARIHYLKNIT